MNGTARRICKGDTVRLVRDVKGESQRGPEVFPEGALAHVTSAGHAVFVNLRGFQVELFPDEFEVVR